MSYEINFPTVISFSGGRTSAFLLHKILEFNHGLPKEAHICFANTGKEEEATLKFVHDCETNWSVPITWLEYRKDGFEIVSYDKASRDGRPFAELIEKRKYLPNPVARFCTSELKVLTIKKYMNSIGIDDFEQMLGIRADEKRRAAKLRDGNLTPLIDDNVDQQQVQSFWRSQSFNLGLEFRNGVTSLGNCDLCYLKGPNQIMSLISSKPDRAIWWAEQEKKIGGTFRSDRPSYEQMMNFSKSQFDMFGDYPEESISCFCGD